MDFEVKELEAETERERLEKIRKFEPPEVERRQLTPAEIAAVRVKNMEYFHQQQKLKKGRGADGRVEFVPCIKFEGRMKGYYFGRGEGGEEEVGENKHKTKIETQDRINMGYYIDYAQMRHLMQMDIGDRCEARYKRVRNYFNGMVVGIHDEDCTYDVRFQHGHVELKIPCEHVRKKDWVGKIKEGDGVARSLKVANRAAQGCEHPNFKGSHLGRFPLVLADFWTSDHLSARSRSTNVASRTRAHGTAK